MTSSRCAKIAATPCHPPAAGYFFPNRPRHHKGPWPVALDFRFRSYRGAHAELRWEIPKRAIFQRTLPRFKACRKTKYGFVGNHISRAWPRADRSARSTSSSASGHRRRPERPGLPCYSKSRTDSRGGHEKVRLFRVIGGNRRLCPFLELISVPCRGFASPNAMEVGPVRGTSIMGAQLKVCQLRVLFDYSHKGRSPF